MVTQVIRVLHKLEFSPRATKFTRVVLPVLACTKRVEVY